jgi:hypothetical protein
LGNPAGDGPLAAELAKIFPVRMLERKLPMAMLLNNLFFVV